MVLSAAAIGWGWWIRDEIYVTPELGTGYALGIVGTAMMVILLTYSIRKRLPAGAPLGSIRAWFSFHMMLGLLAPAAILFHSNFQLGSLNSSVALACVLLVSGSGVVGRMIYPKVHVGFEGRRASLNRLKATADQRLGALGQAIDDAAGLHDLLEEFESRALGSRGDAGFWRLLWLGRRQRRIRQKCQRTIKRAGTQHGKISRGALRSRMLAVNEYLDAVRAVAELRTYERVFSLWHALHLPLCFVLFIAAAVHVVAVHMY